MRRNVSMGSFMVAQEKAALLNQFLSSAAVYEGWAFGEFAAPTITEGDREALQQQFEKQYALGRENLYNLRLKSRQQKSPTESPKADHTQLEPRKFPEANKAAIGWDLSDAIPFCTEASEVLVQDSFTKCFTNRRNVPWNWNLYLFPAWVLGVVFRYLILFPLRLLGLIFGTLIFLFLFFS